MSQSLYGSLVPSAVTTALNPTTTAPWENIFTPNASPEGITVISWHSCTATVLMGIMPNRLNVWFCGRVEDITALCWEESSTATTARWVNTNSSPWDT